jgi:hypothetical protein
MLDAYVRRARFYPALIAAAPALGLAVTLVSWKSLGLPHAVVAATIAIITAVLSDIARRRGRAIEPTIILRMGGLPSVTMMRHSDETLDAATKAAIHQFVGDKIGASAFSPQAERENPASADEFYGRCGSWLRENTRDLRKFKLLFEENVTYGFRRNLLGLKWLALLLNATIIVLSVGMFSNLGSNPGIITTAQLALVLAVAFLHAIYFIFFVDEAAVIDAARIYARQLLLCTETLRTGSPKTAARSRKNKS